MSKHQWRDSLQSLCENHTSPEEDEQLKLSKIEVQNKVSKALKLVHDRRPNRKNKNAEGNSRRESELSQLVEDMNRQYQLIYDLHFNLRRQLSQTYDDVTEEGFYTASSDSEPEPSEDGNHEIVSRNQEVEALKQKLTLTAQEKEFSLSKIEQLENETKQLKKKLVDKEGEHSDLGRELKARNKEASIMMKDLEARVESLNREKGRLIKQTEYESKAVKKMQMKESDLEAFVLSLKKAMEDKEDQLSALHQKVKGLESELNGLEGKLRELEEQLLQKDQENCCLQDEVDSLQEKVNRLQNVVIEYGKRADNDQVEIDQLNSEKVLLEGRILELEKQVEERGDEVNYLQQEVEDMNFKHLEMTCEREKCKEKLSLVEKHNTKLTSKIMDQQSVLNEQEKTMNIQLNSDKEVLQGRILELEKQLQERADEVNHLQHHMTCEREKCQEKLSLEEKRNTELTSKITNQQSVLNQQENTISRLEEECKIVKSRLLQATERKMEEMAVQFQKSLEANITILRQRIRVAEQVQTENKESFKSIKERCWQEQLQKHSENMATSKAEITNFVESTSDLFDRVDYQVGDFSTRISWILDEISVMKNWVREMKPDKDEYTILSSKVAELKKRVVENEEEVKKVGEEKKEAIRQLCMSVEYHQNRCDQLIKLLSKRKC